MYQRMDSQISTCSTCTTLYCLYPILSSLGSPLLRATQSQAQLLVVGLQALLYLFASDVLLLYVLLRIAVVLRVHHLHSTYLRYLLILSPYPILYSTTTYQSVCDSTYYTVLLPPSLCVHYVCSYIIPK